jgi:UPF0755 protein
MRKGLIAAAFGLALCGAAAATAWGLEAYLQQPHTNQAAAQIEVKRGARLRPVLDELAQHGVLEHPGLLYAYARLTRSVQVRSGIYHFEANASPKEILITLNEGRVTLEQFTVAEGLNRWQIRDLLSQQGWLTPAAFDSLCDDVAFLRANHIPGPTCEGYLFPETYKFARGVAPSALLQTMFVAYRRQLAALTAAHHGHLPLPLPLDEKQMVTLASIVEKETGAPEERPHIACVFYNRLRAKPAWRLETDPTVIYAATLADPNFNGNLTRRHLHELDNPYNTYRVYGLPPGPIASPGAAALAAVVAPRACSDFFFVSSNNGQHIFCPTLKCHQEAVQRWQIDYFRHPRPPASVSAPAGAKHPPAHLQAHPHRHRPHHARPAQ